MREILRSNDPILLSFATSLLTDAGIDHHLADAHESVINGSLDMLSQRLLVSPPHFPEAHQLLTDAQVIQ